MNIGETKQAFKRDVETDDYDIITVEKLHLNVSRIFAKIKGLDVIVGFSYSTPIVFSIKGYEFRTLKDYSLSTSKHKGQVLRGLDGKLIDLEHDIFKSLFYEVMNGKIPTVEYLKEIINDKYMVIKTSDKPYNNIFEYLTTHEIIKKGYKFEDKIKDIIRKQIYWNGRDKVDIDETSFAVKKHKVKDENWGYEKTVRTYLFNEKEYKNLSFLNQFNFENIKAVI